MRSVKGSDWFFVSDLMSYIAATYTYVVPVCIIHSSSSSSSSLGSLVTSAISVLLTLRAHFIDLEVHHTRYQVSDDREEEGSWYAHIAACSGLLTCLGDSTYIR